LRYDLLVTKGASQRREPATLESLDCLIALAENCCGLFYR
jgi:hypothetical protein